MLKLETVVSFNNCDCNITVTDNTGFQPTLEEGFIQEGSSLPSIDDFHISDGYLFNVLVKASYNGTNTIVNTDESIYNIPSGEVDPVYSNNYPSKRYDLDGDGMFYLKRLFIVSRSFYESMDPLVLEDKVIVFYDEDELKFFKVESSVEEEIQLVDLAMSFTSTYFGAFSSHKLFSTCFLKKCYYLLQKDILNESLGLNPPKAKKIGRCNTGNCPDESDLVSKRDFIHHTLHVLNYLIDCNYFNDALRLLESLNSCSFICKEVGVRAGKDCGCG